MYGLLRKALLTAALLIALSVSAGCAGADKEQASAEEWHYIQFDNTQKVVYDAFRKDYGKKQVGIISFFGGTLAGFFRVKPKMKTL